ncbi:hypothetical protein FACS189490_11430 [Clostridia bacterium]|nr:hypothetical protein FACS189490_11430 [Clostridia bacterium]
MLKKELLKNKLCAFVMVALGAFSLWVNYDATFFIFAIIFSAPIFFAREDLFS